MINLVKRFGELVRKLWNPRNFKAHVSPHEMLQAVVKCSKKRFQITKQGDPVEFLAWLLNSLHLTLNGTKNANSSIIYKAFQGKMKVYTRKIPPIDLVNMIKLLINNNGVLFSCRVKMKKENY
jgi:U4/U6.U5 tri-snRNP-associated protein 2